MNSGRRLMGTAFTFALAALLGPHAFGVVAIAIVYVAFVRMLLEQGFATAIIQREDLQPEHLDSAFWLNLVWCLVLAGASAASAGLVARAYDTPDLGPVIAVLSLVLVFEGLQIAQQALMERQLDFKRLAIRENASVFLGGATGIPLALAGAGVWALVAQQVVASFVMLVLIWGMSSWRPRLRFSVRHARDLLGFSGSVFAANLGGFVNRRADALLLGVFFGPAAVGIYRIADRVVDVVVDVTMRPVAAVSLPVLSRLQEDPAQLRAMVTRLLRTTMIATVPALLVVVACSEEIVAVLGDEWLKAGGALKLLCLVGIGKAIGFFAGPVLFAASRARFRALMLWAVAAVSVLGVVGAGVLLADASLERQVVGMAGTRAILFLVILVPLNLGIIAWVTGLSIPRFLPRAIAPVLAGAAALGAEWALHAAGLVQSLPALPQLVAVGAVSVVVAVAVLLALEPLARAYALALARRVRAARTPAPQPSLATGRNEP
jgi:PST family polysaccharide transporter